MWRFNTFLLVNLLLYVYNIQFQFDYDSELNVMTSQLCLSTSNLVKYCYPFVLNLTENNSWLVSSINNPFPFAGINVNDTNKTKTEIVPLHILPDYIYDKDVFNFHKNEFFNLTSVIKNQDMVNSVGVIGMGYNSSFLSYYYDNFNSTNENLFSYIFITDTIGKIVIEEKGKFKYPKRCTGKINGINRKCDFTSYSFNQIPFTINSTGELMFVQSMKNIYLYDSTVNINQFNEILTVQIGCRVLFDLNKVSEYICENNKLIEENKDYLMIEMNNNFTLQFDDLFLYENNMYKCLLHTIVDDNNTKIEIGFNIMKNYHMQFSLIDNFTNHLTTFERIYINKPWTVTIYAVLYGGIFSIVMISSQIYIMVKK